MLYDPYGETRWITGTLTTEYQYTGQRAEHGLGLYDYVARFYDPYMYLLSGTYELPEGLDMDYWLQNAFADIEGVDY